MATAQAERFRVRVGGWFNSRYVILRESEVAFEVALAGCSHCDVCRSRIYRVDQALQGLKHRTEYQDGGLYYVLPYPSGRPNTPEKVAEFLSETLRLSIRA